MKRFLTLFLVLAIAGACLAQGVPAPSTPRPMIDSAGTLLDAAHPMPVTGTFTSTDAPTTTGTSSAILLSSTPRLVAAIAGMRSMTLYASGTFAYGIGSFPSAIANRPEVYSVTIPGSYSVSVWTTATPAYLAVDRLGD